MKYWKKILVNANIINTVKSKFLCVLWQEMATKRRRLFFCFFAVASLSSAQLEGALQGGRRVQNLKGCLRAATHESQYAKGLTLSPDQCGFWMKFCGLVKAKAKVAYFAAAAKLPSCHSCHSWRVVELQQAAQLKPPSRVAVAVVVNKTLHGPWSTVHDPKASADVQYLDGADSRQHRTLDTGHWTGRRGRQGETHWDSGQNELGQRLWRDRGAQCGICGILQRCWHFARIKMPTYRPLYVSYFKIRAMAKKLPQPRLGPEQGLSQS